MNEYSFLSHKALILYSPGLATALKVISLTILDIGVNPVSRHTTLNISSLHNARTPLSIL